MSLTVGFFKWWMLLPLLAISLLGALGNRPVHGMRPSPILPPIRKPAGSTRWVANQPQININNANLQGGGSIDQDIGGGFAAPIVEPLVDVQPLTMLHPIHPDRLVWMVFALALAGFPLIVDWARDWPEVEYGESKYSRPLWQWLGAGVFMVLALGLADSQSGSRSRYGHYVSAVQLNPKILASAVEGGEMLVTGMEDMIFGDGRHVLGTILGALLTVLVSQRKPMESAPKTEYASWAIQLLYLGGFFIVAMLFWNA